MNKHELPSKPIPQMENTHDFIIRCIKKAKRDYSIDEDWEKSKYDGSKQGTLTGDDQHSDLATEEEQGSFLLHYMDMEEEISNSTLNKSSTACSSLATPSLCSEKDDDIDMDDVETCSTNSLRTAHHTMCDDTSQNGDKLPKSFLQLKGITVGNFNMGCNFHVSEAIWIMIQFNISILAIQEHTAWNKELQNLESASMERHCNKWGYFVTISKLQIVIIDRQFVRMSSRDKSLYGRTNYEMQVSNI